MKIISKQYANFKTMTLTPAKFQKYQPKTVGGVAYTRYLLLERGRKERLTDRHSDYYVPWLFFVKVGGGGKKTTTHTRREVRSHHILQYTL